MAETADQSILIDYIVAKYKIYKKKADTFIRECVKIEDRDLPGLSIPFDLWEAQEPALNAFVNDKLVIVMKARQLGLTWLALAYAVWRMVFHPGYSVVAISRREEPDAKELPRRIEFMLRHMPKWLIRGKKDAPPGWTGATWESTVMSIVIRHPNGEPSVFQSMTAAPDSGRSFTANLIILDEWAHQAWAAEIWAAGFPAVNRPTGGQVLGLSTNKRGSFFEMKYNEARRGANDFTSVFLPWHADPRRDEEWYRTTQRNLPHDYLQEYPETEEDAFSAGEGTAFPEFSREVHVCKDFRIPEHWRRWRANDPGYTAPFGWYWFAVDEDGKVYVYREFTRDRKDEKLNYSDQAKIVTSMSKMTTEEDLVVEEKFSFTVTGWDSFNKHPESGKAYVDFYRENGVTGCIPPTKDKKTSRVHRKAILHEYLKPYVDENTDKLTAKLQIFESCHVLIEKLPMLVVDEDDPEKVADGGDDQYDALTYGLAAWHTKTSKRPEDTREGIVLRHKRKLAGQHGKYARFKRPLS